MSKDICSNCKGSLWLYNEKRGFVYCFYCGFIDSEENRLELKKLKANK